MVSYLGEAVDCEYVWAEISPSVAILKTIGIYENQDYRREAGGLADPLYRYIDTDALDALITRGTQATISLTLDDFSVEISENTVHVSAV